MRKSVKSRKKPSSPLLFEEDSPITPSERKLRRHMQRELARELGLELDRYVLSEILAGRIRIVE